MLQWRTTIQAIDPRDGKLRLFDGPHVPGITQEDAERHCQANELGYCEVVGCLVSEIPQDTTGGPDWAKQTEYFSRLN